MADRSGFSEVSGVASGAGISLLGKFIGRAAHLLVEVVLARTLGPGVFGLYTTGWVLFRVLGLIAPLGLDRGVVWFGTRYARTDNSHLKGVLAAALGLAIFSGLLFGASLYIAAEWLARVLFQKPELTDILRGFAPVVALFAGLRVAASATRVSRIMRYAVYSEDLSQTFTHLAMLLMVYSMGWGINGAIAACGVSYLIALILACLFLRKLFPHATRRKVQAEWNSRKLLGYSLTTSMAGISVLLIVWVDRLMLATFRSSTEVGIYQAAAQPVFIFSTIMIGIGSFLMPHIANHHQRGEKEQLHALFRFSTKWGLYLSFPPLLLIWFTPQPLLRVLFGETYTVGATALTLLAAGYLITVACGAVGNMLMLSGNQRHWLVLTSSFLVIDIVLSVLVIPRYGMVGAAMTTALTMAGLAITGLFQVRRVLGMWPFSAAYLRGITAVAVAGVLLFFLHKLDLGQGWLNVGLTAAVAVMVCGIGLALFGLEKEDRELLSVIRGIARNRP